MVLSASGVHSYDRDGSPWSIFFVSWRAGLGLFAWFAASAGPGRACRCSRHHHRHARARSADSRHGSFVIAGLSMQPPS